MNWLPTAIDRLSELRAWGYHADGASASEPAALTALALASHRGGQAAARPLDWLQEMQGDDGGVGIESGQSTPAWPTGLAVSAWRAALAAEPVDNRYPGAIDRGVAWMLSVAGESIPRGNWNGHDTSIQGWPWVLGTHSWLEPTAINLIALEHVGRGDHPRAEEARRLLHDRLLPDGGCNYGNTIVFGQELRPHVQPTGLCLLALAGRNEITPRIERSIEFLLGEIARPCGTSSLCYALMALAAWKRDLIERQSHLDTAAARVLSRDPSSHKLALLTLAALGDRGPLVMGRSAGNAASELSKGARR